MEIGFAAYERRIYGAIIALLIGVLCLQYRNRYVRDRFEIALWKTLDLPPGSKVRRGHGIDSYVGEITLGSTKHVLRYSIGGLRWNAAQDEPNGPFAWQRHEDDSETWIDYSLSVKGQRKVLIVSFPGRPLDPFPTAANFFADVKAESEIDEILKVLRTFR